ncbi:MAG: hypothetical protein H3C48_10560 [Chitinophagaceae bacterium]|nr:hypothetical protein [Chitinophagaceae bacterium]
MEQVQQLSDFFKAIEGDGRIAPMHICVYAALLYYRHLHRLENPFHVFSYEIMSIAKISNKSTYHKSIRALNEYGYLHFKSTRKKNKGSTVHLFLVKDEIV